ncbi:hypothetical protein P3342_001960 [Pyrenophora teres f. teres]|nr:hypothetical protein P3342_001960 [Pyrenophora teres f. teres]
MVYECMSNVRILHNPARCRVPETSLRPDDLRLLYAVTGGQWFLMRLHLHMCFFTFTFTITVLKPRAPPAALATPLLLTLSAIAPSFSSSSCIFRCLVILHSRIESNLPHLEVLQQGLFPGDVKYLSQPEFLNLPAHFHPILIDRIVDFIYTSDYHFCPADDDVTKLKQKDFVFHHATLLPAINANKSAMAAALVGIRDYEFHLRMYALAEELDWDALKSAAYAKLSVPLTRSTLDLQRH